MKKDLSKEQIIETTLLLINEKNGISNVNLREIAKRLNCAHTNLYNYFNSLNDIFWESLKTILERMTSNNINKNNSKDNLILSMESLIDFSLTNKGWYRLIWIDNIHGVPNYDLNQITKIPGDKLKILVHNYKKNLNEEQLNNLCNIIHCYIHGEISKYLNNRIKVDEKTLKENIINNINLLCENIY